MKLPLESDEQYANYIRTMQEEADKYDETRYIASLRRIDEWLLRAVVAALVVLVIAQTYLYFTH